eukprot:g594.t1
MEDNLGRLPTASPAVRMLMLGAGFRFHGRTPVFRHRAGSAFASGKIYRSRRERYYADDDDADRGEGRADTTETPYVELADVHHEDERTPEATSPGCLTFEALAQAFGSGHESIALDVIHCGQATGDPAAVAQLLLDKGDYDVLFASCKGVPHVLEALRKVRELTGRSNGSACSVDYTSKSRLKPLSLFLGRNPYVGDVKCERVGELLEAIFEASQDDFPLLRRVCCVSSFSREELAAAISSAEAQGLSPRSLSSDGTIANDSSSYSAAEAQARETTVFETMRETLNEAVEGAVGAFLAAPASDERREPLEVLFYVARGPEVDADRNRSQVQQSKQPDLNLAVQPDSRYSLFAPAEAEKDEKILGWTRAELLAGKGKIAIDAFAELKYLVPDLRTCEEDRGSQTPMSTSLRPSCIVRAPVGRAAPDIRLSPGRGEDTRRCVPYINFVGPWLAGAAEACLERVRMDEENVFAHRVRVEFALEREAAACTTGWAQSGGALRRAACSDSDAHLLEEIARRRNGAQIVGVAPCCRREERDFCAASSVGCGSGPGQQFAFADPRFAFNKSDARAGARDVQRFYVFHGTSRAAADQICRHRNFRTGINDEEKERLQHKNPSLSFHTAQAFGRGVYFAFDPETALHYVKGRETGETDGGAVVVCAVEVNAVESRRGAEERGGGGAGASAQATDRPHWITTMHPGVSRAALANGQAVVIPNGGLQATRIGKNTAAEVISPSRVKKDALGRDAHPSFGSFLLMPPASEGGDRMRDDVFGDGNFVLRPLFVLHLAKGDATRSRRTVVERLRKLLFAAPPLPERSRETRKEFQARALNVFSVVLDLVQDVRAQAGATRLQLKRVANFSEAELQMFVEWCEPGCEESEVTADGLLRFRDLLLGPSVRGEAGLARAATVAFPQLLEIEKQGTSAAADAERENVRTEPESESDATLKRFDFQSFLGLVKEDFLLSDARYGFVLGSCCRGAEEAHRFALARPLSERTALQRAFSSLRALHRSLVDGERAGVADAERQTEEDDQRVYALVHRIEYELPHGANAESWVLLARSLLARAEFDFDFGPAKSPGLGFAGFLEVFAEHCERELADRMRTWLASGQGRTLR